MCSKALSLMVLILDLLLLGDVLVDDGGSLEGGLVDCFSDADVIVTAVGINLRLQLGPLKIPPEFPLSSNPPDPNKPR